MSRYVHAEQLPYSAHLRQTLGTEPAPPELTPEEMRIIGAPPANEPHPLLRPDGFRWSDCAALFAASSLGAPLESLQEATRDEELAWAWEQFDAARRAFLGGQPRESLAAVQRALRGEDRHPGLRQDGRLHFLVGLIHLGAGPQPDPDVVDLAVAVRSFSMAARLASPDRPADVAWPQLAAAWASYGNGDLDQALASATAAGLVLSSLAEPPFIAAKVHFHRGEAEPGGAALARALDRDPDYLWLALRDADFTPHAAQVLALIDAARLAWQQRAADAVQRLAGRAAGFSALTGPDREAGESGPDLDLVAAYALLDEARTALAEPTLYGQLTAARTAARAGTLLDRLATRAKRDRLLADDAIREAAETREAFLALELADYRFGAPTLEALERATQAIEKARQIFATETQVAHREAERVAHQVVVQLRLALEAYKSSAIEHVLAQREALAAGEADASAARPARASHPVRTGAWIGALLALWPGGCGGLTLLNPSESASHLDALLRLCLSLIIGAGCGALLGTLFALVRPGAAEPAPDTTALVQERQRLDDLVAQIRALSLGARNSASDSG